MSFLIDWSLDGEGDNRVRQCHAPTLVNQKIYVYSEEAVILFSSSSIKRLYYKEVA